MSEDFGAVLHNLRVAAGLSLRGLARQVPCSHAHIADMEAGRRQPGPGMAVNLDSILHAGGQLVSLAPDAEQQPVFGLRSHKFVVSHLDSPTRDLAADLDACQHDGILPGHWTTAAEHPVAESCNLHLWEHGAVIHHVLEEGSWPTLTALAQWRYASYARDLAWASDELTRVTGTPVRADYILSAYWITDPTWTGDRLDTALRLICMPRVLVGDNPDRACPETETTILREGLSHPDLVPFGVTDTSIGYASWSGVVYHPLDTGRALRESDLVNVELAVQALWGHCSWLAQQVEAGADPPVAPEHGWRWLRAARSRLSVARPQETGPHRSMRKAILSTSGLPAMLDEALVILRETTP